MAPARFHTWTCEKDEQLIRQVSGQAAFRAGLVIFGVPAGKCQVFEDGDMGIDTNKDFF